MDLAHRTLQHKSASLIELFCFILSELQQELEQTVDERVNELSNKFREQHLTHEQSLFKEETFEATVIRLKEILDEIDKITAYKDDDYWQLYEAIEAFLYGELDMKNTHNDGIFWGINNFWSVWEEMCHTYSFKTFDDIVYADTRIMIDGKSVANKIFGGRHRVFCKAGFNNPFFIEFRGDKRWMRPDLVRATYASIFERVINIKSEPCKGSYMNCHDFQIRLLDETEESYVRGFEHLVDEFTNSKIQRIKTQVYRTTRKKNSLYLHYYPLSVFNEKKKVIQERDFETQYKYIVVDYKYFNVNSVCYANERIKQSEIKQLSYELALQSSRSSEKNLQIESQFVIPFFYSKDYHFKDGNPIGDFMENNDLASCLKDNGIKVFKANFFEIQRVYLQP